MDMRRYEFKDSRPIFKWIYIILLLNVIHSIIDIAEGSFTMNYNLVFMLIYVVIAWVIYKKTTVRVYIDEKKVEMKKIHYYMVITEIKAGYDIIIKSDGWIDKIAIYELDKNYDEYKELLEHILQRVDSKVAIKTGGAEKLLETIKTNREIRYSKEKSIEGKVRLGGFLKFFNVTSYIVVVFGGLALIGVFISLLFGQSLGKSMDLKQQQAIIQFILMFVTNLLTVILLEKRMNRVKYVLVLTPIINIFTVTINFVKSIIDFTNGIELTYDTIGVLIRIAIAVLMIKVYIYYIDNFDRPKQTLVN